MEGKILDAWVESFSSPSDAKNLVRLRFLPIDTRQDQLCPDLPVGRSCQDRLVMSIRTIGLKIFKLTDKSS